MAFYQIPAPDLSSLILGGVTIVSMSADGFSEDEQFLLVRVQYLDDGVSPASQEYAYFIYDLESEAYVVNLNLLAGGDAAQFTQLTQSELIGSSTDWETVSLVTIAGSDTSRLMSIGPEGVRSSDLIVETLGVDGYVDVERFVASRDGRFLAIQTSSALLAPDGYPDVNDSSDVYLLDRLTGSVTRVTTIGGTGMPESSFVSDIRFSNGEVQVLFITDARFSSDDQNSADTQGEIGSRTDLYLWRSAVDSSGLVGAPSIELISTSAVGVATGYVSTDFEVGPKITDAGIYFTTSSDISDSDTNLSDDVYLRSNDGIVSRVELAGIDELTKGSQLVDVSSSGRFIYIRSDSPEFGGLGDVPQIVKVDTINGSFEVVSNNGYVANNFALYGATGDSGSSIAFTSLANNLVANDLTPDNETDLFIYALEGVRGRVYEWQTHSLLSDVQLTASDSTTGLEIAQASSSSAGDYVLGAMLSDSIDLSVTRALSSDETGRVISAADALAALKLAVGLNPNSASMPVSPYQYLAADVNEDGRVSAADALSILKMAVNLSGAPERKWHFVDESYDFWDESAWNQPSYSIGRSSIEWEQIRESVGSNPGELNLVAVLKGDVNGSWASSQSGQQLQQGYFDTLEGQSIGPVEQWWLV